MVRTNSKYLEYFAMKFNTTLTVQAIYKLDSFFIVSSLKMIQETIEISLKSLKSCDIIKRVSITYNTRSEAALSKSERSKELMLT